MFDSLTKTVKWINVPCLKDVWKDDIEKVVARNTDELEAFIKEMQEMDIAEDDLIVKLLEEKDEKVRELFYTYLGE